MTIFFVAGEASGDLLGAEIVRALKKTKRPPSMTGVAGPRMRREGVAAFLPMEELQVMGFLDVALSLPKLMTSFWAVRKEILQTNPSAVVTIDYPVWNLRLAASLRKAGFKGKLIHLVAPTVWAWKKDRIRALERNIDLLMTILPFEEKFFATSLLKTAYISHPLIQTIEQPSSDRLPNQIALFPGSREKELARQLPDYFEVAQRLQRQQPHLEFLVSVAHPSFLTLLQREAELKGLRVRFFLEGEKEAVMRKCRFAIAKSGTVILELALHGTPTIVTYGLSPIDYLLAKYLFHIDLPFYSLPNLILERKIFPELIGPKFTADELYREALGWTTSLPPTGWGEELRHAFGPKKSGETAAELILSQIQG
jgi:lipid-A-disaccharide synthase